MQKNEMKKFLDELSAELRATAKTSKEEVLRMWPSSSKSDREMRAVSRSDEKALVTVGSLLKAGHLTKAYNKASGLDTLVRDMIPDRFWDFIESTKSLSLKNK